MDCRAYSTTSLEGNQETFKEKLIRLLNEGEQTLHEFQEKIKDRNVVIFLGSTRSGKSTLINYLIGTNLEAVDTGITGLKIRESGNSEGPKIGCTTSSETTVPGVYELPGTTSMVISDSPGFDDNRGPERNVINAIFINQLKHAKTVKFVMVADLSELISDNVNIFLNALEHIDELLSNCIEIRPSLAVIVTKVTQWCTQSDIADLLQRQILRDEFKFHKYLVENAATNQSLIGIFKVPRTKGRIQNNLHFNIKDAIEESQTINMKEYQINFTLSEKAKIALRDVYPEYIDTNYFTAELNKTIQDFVDFFKDNWIFASYDEELSGIKRALKSVKLSLLEQKNTPRNQLAEIQTSLESLLGTSLSQDFVNNFKFIVILDQSCIIEETYREYIQKHYKVSLSKLIPKLNILLVNIEMEMIERSDNHIIFPLETSYSTMSRCVAQNLIQEARKLFSDVSEEVVHKLVKMSDEISADEFLRSSITAVTSSGTVSNIVCNTAEILVQNTVERAYMTLGVTAATTGVGVLGCATYYTYEEIYGKRIKARRVQSRPIYNYIITN